MTLDPDAKIGLFGHGRIADAFDRILGRPVDLADDGSLRKPFQLEIERDAIYAF